MIGNWSGQKNKQKKSHVSFLQVKKLPKYLQCNACHVSIMFSPSAPEWLLQLRLNAVRNLVTDTLKKLTLLSVKRGV